MPRDEPFEEEAARGEKAMKLWAGREIPEIVLEFLNMLDETPEKVSIMQLRMFIGQYFVSEGVTNGWLRYLNDIANVEEVEIETEDGYTAKIDMTFRNPIVRQEFYMFVIDEFRRSKNKKDPITQLAEELGKPKGTGYIKTRKPSGGGHL